MKLLGSLFFLSCVIWQGLRLPPLWSLTAEGARFPNPVHISSLTKVLSTSTTQLVNITTAPNVLYQLVIDSKESKFSFSSVVLRLKSAHCPYKEKSHRVLLESSNCPLSGLWRIKLLSIVNPYRFVNLWLVNLKKAHTLTIKEFRGLEGSHGIVSSPYARYEFLKPSRYETNL